MSLGLGGLAAAASPLVARLMSVASGARAPLTPSYLPAVGHVYIDLLMHLFTYLQPVLLLAACLRTYIPTHFVAEVLTYLFISTWLLNYFLVLDCRLTYFFTSLLKR